MAEEPTRLLVIVTGLGRGGTERHLAAILPALAARGMEIRLLALRPGGALAASLRQGGVAVTEMADRAAPLRALAGFLAVFFLCLRWRPHLVHFFLPEAYLVGGLAAWCAGQRRCVMSRRSLNAYQQAHPRIAGVERWLHRRMDALLGNSRAVCKELAAEGAPPDRIGLIRNGLVTRAPARSRASVREALGIAPDVLVIACVANLIPYKGHADLLDGFAEALPHLPPGSTLLLIGRDEGLGISITAQAEARALRDHVHLLGERGDVPDLLAASDVFVLASHEEGSPNAVIEAMAAGLPVIVTDVGGSPEAVGEAGIVVPPRQSAAIAAALARIGQDHAARAALGAAASRRVAEFYSLDRCVGRYAALYAALRGGRPFASALAEPA